METVEIPLDFQQAVLRHLPYAEPDALTADAELAALGLDSMGVVELLGDLEETFGLELPDELLTEETFATAGSLWTTVSGLLVTVGPGADEEPADA